MKEKKGFVENIADMEADFPQWYTDVILKTGLVDYGPVKGTMVIRPYGYEIWENIQEYLNKKFKETGHKNAYFPMFIPESYLKREADHVEGFAPEVAVVTHAGGAELAEKLVVRPTSETIICDMYGKWIKSYRDLPVLMNQWCNVVRWEKATRPFLRTSEFLWQEGHTVHATQEEADVEALKMLDVYAKMGEELLAIPFFTGKKTESEKFPGAVETFTIEAMMHDGKSLQSGTTHNLGQKFAKAFGIRFLNKNEELEYGYSTSWGVSTRLIGALIMVHGDQRGLVLPPRVAPIQTVIIPIASAKPGVVEKCNEVKELLKSKGIRVELDNSDNSPGWKFNEWEMKGVPVRVEIGPRDIEAGVASVFRRDTLEKVQVPFAELGEHVENLLNTIHKDMFEKAKKYRDERIVGVKNVDELLRAVDDKKFTRAHWCGDPECEAKIKEQTAATSRMIESDGVCEGECVCCGKHSNKVVLFARSY